MWGLGAPVGHCSAVFGSCRKRGGGGEFHHTGGLLLYVGRGHRTQSGRFGKRLSAMPSLLRSHHGKGVAALLGVFVLALATVTLHSMGYVQRNSNGPSAAGAFDSAFDAIWALQSPHLPPYDLATQKFVLSGDAPIWIDVCVPPTLFTS